MKYLVPPDKLSYRITRIFCGRKTFANNEPNQQKLLRSGKNRVHLLVIIKVLRILLLQIEQSSQMFDARKTL